MTRPNERVTRAILLRSVDYGEADRVVTLLTEHYGKRAVFAASARKSTKRYGSALEPFRVIEVRYREKPEQRLARLVSARVLDAYDQITSELHTIYWASLAVEWTAELCMEGDGSDIFDSLSKLLSWLSRHDRGFWYTEVGCLRFAMLLLAQSGLFPSLDRCARTDVPLADLPNPHFSYAGGGLICDEEVRPEDHAVLVSRDVLQFMTAIAKGQFPGDHQVEVLREARGIVIGLIRTTTEKEPKSLPLVRSLWL